MCSRFKIASTFGFEMAEFYYTVSGSILALDICHNGVQVPSFKGFLQIGECFHFTPELALLF